MTTSFQLVNDNISSLPTILRDKVEQLIKTFLENAAVANIPLADYQDLLPILIKVFACSEFVAYTCTRHPEILAGLITSGDLGSVYDQQAYYLKLKSDLKDINSSETLALLLRSHRQREMVRIAWRDIAGWADLQHTMLDLSNMADAYIDTALQLLHEWQCSEFGIPINSRGEPQSLIILGMGKLGAQELNFSSDVDLIFAYSEEGETQGGVRQSSNSEYFTRLGRELINVLNQTTPEGFVFRVDMRLRPFGDSGPLALNFDALENYYQVYGREWERYAMIKARVVAGDREAGSDLLRMLKPFVFRRYLDFGAFESIRDLKQRIAQEVKTKGRDRNIKLGVGGIREIEFIGQAFQLIRGGRSLELQERQILKVLELLLQLDYLPDFVVSELQDAYVFMRNTEHRLQEFADQQTHDIPLDEVSRTRLAYSMGFPDWPSYETVLHKHRQHVHNHFEQVFSAPQTREPETGQSILSALWQGTLEHAHVIDSLAALKFDDPEQTAQLLKQLHNSYSYRSLSSNGKLRFDRLMPLLLGAAGNNPNPSQTLQRLARLVETIARRTAYLALLGENPMALSQLVKLCSASPWISELLTKHPILLDELLDPRTLYALPDRTALQTELAQRLQGISNQELDLQMDTLRQFKQVNVLRVAAADLIDAIPLMEVSDHLTWIAEVILHQVLQIAWNDLVKRHGAPVCTLNGQPCDTGFAIVAYGKLGGIELGYGSDLDLVFLYACEDDQQLTNGSKPIVTSIFFTRLGQRIIHILNTLTPAGVLYEVDMRLRPSGESGMLVSNIAMFGDYQVNKAWTWEHQALVRARVVAGDKALFQRFSEIRHQVLARRRDQEALRKEVREMRVRMRQANANPNKQLFDLKQGAGGIADIEFMVQYGVLAWSYQWPELQTYTDNIRMLQALGKVGILTSKEVELLSDAYRVYRARVHKLTLQGEPSTVAQGEFLDFQTEVIKIWHKLMQYDKE